jgi:F-type H+-transporting ATPase subunit delta
MKITKQSRRDAKQLFRSAQVNGVLEEGKARQVVDELLAQKPRGYEAILAHFQRLLKLDMDRRNALIETVIPLDDAAQTNVKSALTKRYGAGLTFNFTQNPALIGGMRIKVGSDVYDGSIQSRLSQLQEV